MKPIVSIIMGSTSDLPVMEKAAALLNEMQIPFPSRYGKSGSPAQRDANTVRNERTFRSPHAR